jgi:putative Holliday junction resolvase
MSPAASAGSILAFDFGSKRIGVAVGETQTRIAHPLATIALQSDVERFDAIKALVDEWKPSRLVVGLPLHADGAPHETTARAQRFARRLEGRFGIPVTLFDERFTTQAARSALSEGRVRERTRKSVRDRIAAQIILQTYLDQVPADTPTDSSAS